MAYPLIGLIGRKRAGKDTFAAGIEPLGFTRYAFADKLKATLLDVNPWVKIEQDETYISPWLPDPDFVRLQNLVALTGWEAAKELREVRRLLQEHGVAIRKHVGEDVWLSAVMEDVLRDPGPAVVTDVRFHNEADAIEAHGGVLVRVTRDVPGADNHVSETELADRPTWASVANASTPGQLQDCARVLAHSLLFPSRF